MSADSYEDVATGKNDAIPALEVPPQELYHAKSFITRWIFCQDAKVIGIQYALTAVAIGLVALVLSWMMRLQLAFPELVPFLGPAEYYQFVTMHGMIMVVYLLTALFLVNFFGNLGLWISLSIFFILRGLTLFLYLGRIYKRFK